MTLTPVAVLGTSSNHPQVSFWYVGSAFVRDFIEDACVLSRAASVVIVEDLMGVHLVGFLACYF
jgi:hypothetical protein